MKKKTIRELMIERGFKMTPIDHPIYNTNQSISFITIRNSSKKDKVFGIIILLFKKALLKSIFSFVWLINNIKDLLFPWNLLGIWWK